MYTRRERTALRPGGLPDPSKKALSLCVQPPFNVLSPERCKRNGESPAPLSQNMPRSGAPLPFMQGREMFDSSAACPQWCSWLYFNESR